MSVWLVITSSCRTLDASKAVVRKIRFAPGKGNSKFFVLCNTKLDIRDINAVSWGEGGRGEGGRGGRRVGIGETLAQCVSGR